MSGYTAGRRDAVQAFAADRDLLLWLHAEASWKLTRQAALWELLKDRVRAVRRYNQTIDTLVGDLADTRGKLGEAQGNHWAAREALAQAEIDVARLRREVEFEANGGVGLSEGVYSRDNLGFPPCACVTDEQAAVLRAGGFSRPVCTVHPEGLEFCCPSPWPYRAVYPEGVPDLTGDEPPEVWTEAPDHADYSSLSVLPEEKP